MKFFVMILFVSLFSGCSAMPQKSVDMLFGWMKTPPGYVPSDRVDVWNKMPNTYMVLSDQGGEKSEHIPYGKKGWLPQNTYLAFNGYDQVDDNIITAVFYDVTTGEEIGPWHYRIPANTSRYQVLDSPPSRELIKYQWWGGWYY